MKKFSIGLVTLALVVAPTLLGTPESKTVQTAEAAQVYSCGTPRWGYQYHYWDVRSGFRDGREIRYREDYRWYCHPQGYWYRAIYYKGFYYPAGIWA